MPVDYSCATFKRRSQAYLLSSTLQPIKVIGLAGDYPLIYKSVIKQHLHPSSIVLCDLKQEIPNVIHDDIYSVSKKQDPDFIDCDFCGTVITCGETLKKCFKLLCNKEHFGICFTFSTRAHGLGNQKSIDWLNEHVFDGKLKIGEVIGTETRINFSSINPARTGFPKYIKYYAAEMDGYNVRFTSYCDTSNMISGIIWR